MQKNEQDIEKCKKEIDKILKKYNCTIVVQDIRLTDIFTQENKKSVGLLIVKKENK